MIQILLNIYLFYCHHFLLYILPTKTYLLTYVRMKIIQKTDAKSGLGRGRGYTAYFTVFTCKTGHTVRHPECIIEKYLMTIFVLPEARIFW